MWYGIHSSVPKNLFLHFMLMVVLCGCFVVGPLGRDWGLTGWLDKGVADLETFWDPENMSFLGGQKEKCETTGRLHWQAAVQFTRRKRATAVHKIFESGDWCVLKRKAPRMADLVAYCKKEDTRVEPYREWGHFAEQGKGKWHPVQESIAAGANKFDLWSEHGDVMSTRYRAAYECMDVLGQKPTEGKFAKEDFPDDFKEIADWSVSHIFYGPTNSWKTQWALAHFATPLFVSHIDKLKHFSATTHDGIIFDDMDFNHWPRTSQIHLVDQEQERDINLRYVCGKIPAGTKKIFTTNAAQGACMMIEDEAIERRIQLHKFEKQKRRRGPFADQGRASKKKK